MWAVAKQQNEMNRCAAIEFLISLGMECYQLNNFMSMMQVLGALEHSSVLRFYSCFDLLSKTVSLYSSIDPPVYIFIHPFTCYISIDLPVYISIHPFTCYISIDLPVYISIHPLIHLSDISIHPFNHSSIHSSVQFI